MDEEKQPRGGERRERVDRLKKIIILSIVIGIAVPWGVCFFLIAHSVRQGRETRELRQTVEALREAVSEQGDRLNALRDDLEQALLREKTTNRELTEKLSSMEAAVEREEIRKEQEASANEALHKVYLTFDDGPSIYTNEILDILKQYDVKATFFVLGKESEEAQQTLKRIVEEGHSLGMHSYTHQYDQIYASREAFAEDFVRIRDYLFQVTGVESRLYRFPGGSSNTVTNVDIHEFIEYLNEENTVYYDWNVASGDAAKVSLSAETILENATRGIDKRPASVILFHDAASRRTTVDALPMILEKIRAMDQTVILPITEDTEPVQHVKSEAEPKE